MRDDLSYLILLCGFYPSINIHTKKGTVSKHKNGEYVQKNDVYQISINKSQYTTFSSCTVDKIPYDDFVYCVELPKWHTLWVMRNGKTSWNGNCRCVVYYTSEEPNVSIEPVQQTTSASTTLISGEPTIVKEIIPGEGGVTSYTFDNDVKIMIHDSSNVEINDIISHIDSLPEVIQNLENVKRFEIKSAENKESHSSYNPHEQVITIETTGNSSQLTDTLTHELAHAVDYASGKTGKTRLSNVSTYSQIHEKDSQYHIYEDPKTGEKRIIGEFPTNYAEKMYYVNKKLYEEAVEWKNQAPDKRTMNSSDERFQEDFAESSKLYLNPKTHDEFVKKFPNRADYLEMIYGKPKFKK